MGNQEGHVTCVVCEAANRAAAEFCWICGSSLDERLREVTLRHFRDRERRFARQRFGVRFSLRSIFLLVLLASVCLAVGRVVPVLGIVLTGFCSLAYIRTALVVREWRESRAKVPTWLLVENFCESLALIVFTVASGVGVFLGTCTVMFLLSGYVSAALGGRGGLQVVALAMGFSCAIAVACGVWLFRTLSYVPKAPAQPRLPTADK